MALARPKKEKTPASKIKKVKSAETDALLGKKVEKLKLPMTGSGDFQWDRFKGQRVVLYFYPKDMTPGCTIEGHDFSRLVSQFKKLNTVILGISKDPVAKHEKFIEKENYTIDLVSDEGGKACDWFDVIKEKNMYGKKVMGIERSTFVINPEGRIEKIWRKVKVEGHAEEVLAFIKGL